MDNTRTTFWLINVHTLVNHNVIIGRRQTAENYLNMYMIRITYNITIPKLAEASSQIIKYIAEPQTTTWNNSLEDISTISNDC